MLLFYHNVFFYFSTFVFPIYDIWTRFTCIAHEALVLERTGAISQFPRRAVPATECYSRQHFFYGNSLLQINEREIISQSATICQCTCIKLYALVIHIISYYKYHTTIHRSSYDAINILAIFSYEVSFEKPHWQRGTRTCVADISQQPC